MEGDALTPNLIKKKENMEELWSLYFDASINRNIFGVGVMLISLDLEKYYFSYRLQFSCNNNVAEYEALIQGLQVA